ncbi:MAG TPA: L-threonylcarbamoyladenylate synthase [Bacteroidota bacterium]|jgi:tRNA threonylcarbamoyl adenosine modification protein (Sua5/YciO/YrdC/YwlC family)|nr:L-threonylcarbamoyladenylate synthase [Bacteroidota bacterium]
MVISINPRNPQKRHLDKIVEVLKNGGVIIYPTDTYYGFGASLMSSDAIDKLYKLKKQEKNKFYSFILPDLKNISEYAMVSDYAFKALKYHLPGPYTFILPASRVIPKKLWSKRKTVGIRIPDNKISTAIAKELGHPIVNTTLLDKKDEGIFNPDLIDKELENKVDLVVNGGIIEPQQSTVIDLTNDSPEIIREGAGSIDWFK